MTYIPPPAPRRPGLQIVGWLLVFAAGLGLVEAALVGVQVLAAVLEPGGLAGARLPW